ncbi:MAG: quinolinate synthase NadA [Candidatus Aureabacteria bacterium]|nr:quinolinate synthase NadA [Candidatus Auribacterota bacterium]
MMDLAETIKKLKKEKNAVILAHNYQRPEVQDIADYVGDSLGLSIEASKTDADVIIFCGVYFMAETAKILSPGKKVVIPDKDAGCPMADMITVQELRELKKRYPGAKILCYVNTFADIKAESDVCCSSSNAVMVVEKAFRENDEIIFVPDKYLADYAQKKTGKNLILWNGYCPSHVKILEEDIRKMKKAHPGAEVLVHPECTAPVISLADEILSTDGMVKYVKRSPAKEFIVATEPGIIHRLKKENPSKEFWPASGITECLNMKLITLDKVLRALETLQYEVDVPQKVITKAKKSIDKMLKYQD